ncbi:cation:proton antiporter [Ectothiorhodospiraceae bacterium WFHF3C12]|nr:cation:proton antiporter [Ectothiorhodospiraceae bacterium WFHF3C12]
MELADINVVLVLLVGATTTAAMLLKAALEPLGVPPLVGYVLLGYALRAADPGGVWLQEPAMYMFELLASLGIVALLFRVGVGSHPHRLWRKLPDASLIWVGNVAVSGLLGFAAAYYLLALELIPSLIAATALTATSIGVAVPVWEEAGKLATDDGALTVDVAELDDVSGILAMALLFAVIPVLASGNGGFWAAFSGAAVGLILKLGAFLVGCYLFAHYLEPRLAEALARLEKPPARMLTVAGVGTMIAALAGWLGFSLAIGALFAGLTFSRNPRTIWSDRSYQILYDFLAPFFFIGIGLKLDPGVGIPALTMGAVLLVAAVAGKLAGAFLPALLATSAAGAMAIGVSMVPRAEIAMVIMDQAHDLGAWAVSDALYGAMTLVTLGTCTVTPPLLAALLRRRNG